MNNIEINTDKVRLENSWKAELLEEFKKPYFLEIKAELLAAKARGEAVYPANNLIFNAFFQTPFNEVKAVILGQDPYHGAGQAMGLSFAVNKGIKIPPSLQNIYKELKEEFPDFVIPNHGDLSNWAKEGVLLLNASLTVLAGKANSHAKIGWQNFTDAAISALSQKRENLVFMLWGNFAKAKANLIDNSKHLILTAAHPSPLAGGAFFGCNHFKSCNEFLISKGEKPINWNL